MAASFPLPARTECEAYFGTVRIFQNGEVMLRIEPFRQAMKWKDFDYEPPPAEPE